MSGDARVQLEAGVLLVATPVIRGREFRRAVVLLLDHADDGTLGVTLGSPTAEALPSGLLARAAPPAVVFSGGPVQGEVRLALGVDPDGRVGWAPLGEQVPVPAGALRVFAGYAGWGPGQLADEVAQEAWEVLMPRPGDLLPARPEGLWGSVVRRLAVPAAFWATLPPDPRAN